jgi:hypothetical protein
VQQKFLDISDLDWKDNFYVAVYLINGDSNNLWAASEVNAYLKH